MSGGGLIRDLEDKLAARYLAVLRETDKDAARLLARKIEIQNAEDDSAAARRDKESRRRAAKADRMARYVALWNGLDPAQQLALATHDARLALTRRLARIMGTTELVQAHNKLEPDTAGSVDFVIGRFRDQNVAPAQVQKFLDENARAWFSLTGHPTNPATLAYTKAQTALAAVLADPKAKPAAIRDALRRVRDTPVVGARKTPLDEAEETLNTLHVIFDVALDHKKLFEAALEKYGYAKQGVAVRTKLIVPCAWTLGDGDGNPALTEKVLRAGIALHRTHIARRYRDLLAQLPPVNHAPLKKALRDLAAMLGPDRKINPQQCTRQITLISATLDKVKDRKFKSGWDDFCYLVSCFGFGFGTIDLRHNADDLMVSVQHIADKAGIMRGKRFAGLAPDQQATMLAAWLEDGEACAAMAALRPAELSEDKDDAPGQIAARIFGRLRVIGKNPDMCEKLIIAETTHAAHMLAALLLLKISGNETARAQSRIDLVPLSESVTDLTGLGALLENLLENASFRSHVAARGRLMAMIAKSDTTRQDGRGAAEYAQYEAAVDIYRALDKMQRKYSELGAVRVSVKNGGGHALQRGGGRVTEIPAIHGRAAADARVTDIGPSTLTIQGQQMTILFCPYKTALGTLEALAAQNLYTKAGIQGEMKLPRFSQNMNKQYAMADARLYAAAAQAAFDEMTSGSAALDDLLLAAPWLAMKAGNVSSRPAGRGEKLPGPGMTPRQAKMTKDGTPPRALAGRAISGERLTAHACLPVFAVLGLPEAMEAVRDLGSARMNPDKYGDALHHLYRAHKIHRDGARATVNAAAMADFDIAWPLLTGQARPAKKQVAALAAQFDVQHYNAQTTLAWLEDYFLRAEKLTYEMVSGQKARDNFCHGDALRRLWPALAAQVAYRDRGAEFARVIECYRTRKFDQAPDRPLDETAYRITQALYTAANVINAPVGILATRTRLEPVSEVGAHGKTRFMRPQSFAEDKVAHLIKLPAALRA